MVPKHGLSRTEKRRGYRLLRCGHGEDCYEFPGCTTEKMIVFSKKLMSKRDLFRRSTECNLPILVISRCGPESLEKQIMTGLIHGKRQRERPCLQWCNGITNMMGESFHQLMIKAQNRDDWRRAVRRAKISTSE